MNSKIGLMNAKQMRKPTRSARGDEDETFSELVQMVEERHLAAVARFLGRFVDLRIFFFWG